MTCRGHRHRLKSALYFYVQRACDSGILAHRGWLSLCAVLVAAVCSMPLQQVAVAHISKLLRAVPAAKLRAAPVAAPRAPAPAIHKRPATARSVATRAMKYRQPIVFNPREEHKGTVILLHGLGDQGDGWASIAADFAPSMPHVKWVFPHAPSVSDTVPAHAAAILRRAAAVGRTSSCCNSPH